MDIRICLEGIYIPSEDIVAREVQGEFIIIPITSGIADTEDELFSLNDTGRAVWKRLDGKKTLDNIVKDLSVEFEATDEIKKDVLGLMDELFKRKMVVEAREK